MIEIDELKTYGWEAAIRGMRNPLNSWDRSDTKPGSVYTFDDGMIPIGPDDMALMWRLVHAGSDHAKFMRFITVTMDICAPLYWWKEFDTYKVGTTANSCSTMHTIMNERFTTEMFSFEDLDEDATIVADILINALNTYRIKYQRYAKLAKTEVTYWKQATEAWRNLIQLLPSSWNQRRTVTMNYEVLRRMYDARNTHKLKEWRIFCKYLKDMLPYSWLVTMDEGDYCEWRAVATETEMMPDD